LFFSEILLILTEGFLDFSIAFFLYTMYDPYKETFHANVIAIGVILLAFIMLPGTLVYALREEEPVLETEIF
jgi:hypothetical protein